MNLIKPKKLNYGDTISIIATSGEVDIKKIEKAATNLEHLGFKVKLGSNIRKQVNYLAGDDEERLSDIHEAFNDKEVKAIICARGGYGAIRLIEKLDYELIKNNPKILCGYSDITALSAAILKRTGLITFSGPMAQSDFADNTDAYTQESFLNTLVNGECKLLPTEKQIYNQGQTQGILFGGNLATLSSLCGTDFIPDEDFIFFVEDIGEPAYKIDRYFTQLFNIEAFTQNIKGIILGEFLGLDEEKYFQDFINSIAKEHNIPIIGTYPITHGKSKATVPYGAAAEIKNETVQIKGFMVE